MSTLPPLPESETARCRCRSCIRERGDTINGLPRLMCEFIVCPHCGDKRCVHAENHAAPCAKTDIYAHNSWVERLLEQSSGIWCHGGTNT